jgi:hypothetical protein
LKRDEPRIWDNYLTVAASIPPSGGTPWDEVIQAMSRVIDLRGKKEGEGAIDLRILTVAIDYVTGTFRYPSVDSEDDEIAEEAVRDDDDPPMETGQRQAGDLPFIARSLLQLLDKQVTPLATHSPQLYALLARVALWRRRPAEALSLHEKAWRAVTSRPAVYESEKSWNEVVEATVGLVDAYRELGDMERERTGGKVEEKWAFKARTAVRGVLGKGRETWEESEGWEKLEAAVEGLKS